MRGALGGIFGLLVVGGRIVFTVFVGAKHAGRAPAVACAMVSGMITGGVLGRIFSPDFWPGYMVIGLICGLGLAVLDRALTEGVEDDAKR